MHDLESSSAPLQGQSSADTFTTSTALSAIQDWAEKEVKSSPKPATVNSPKVATASGVQLVQSINICILPSIKAQCTLIKSLNRLWSGDGVVSYTLCWLSWVFGFLWHCQSILKPTRQSWLSACWVLSCACAERNRQNDKTKESAKQSAPRNGSEVHPDAGKFELEAYCTCPITQASLMTDLSSTKVYRDKR